MSNSDLGYHGPVVVFDLDDTIYSEHDFAVSGYAAVAEALSGSGLAAGDVVSIMTAALEIKANPFDALEGFAEAVGMTDSLDTAGLVEIYRTHKPSIAPYPEAIRLLEEFSASGYRLGMITDGRSLTQRNKISALGLERFFAPCDILISEETGCDKSSPESFVHFVHRYPEASGFFYIGDNPAKDFISANMLGWQTVMLRSAGKNIHPQKLADAADGDIRLAQKSVGSLLEVVDLVNGTGR